MAALAAWRRSPDARARVAPALALLVSGAVAGLFGALGISGALLVVVGAASLANLAGGRGGEPPTPPAQTRTPRAAVIATLALGSLAAALGIADLRGTRAVRAAQDWLELARTGPGDASGPARTFALGAASRAARSSPWDDVTHRLLAEALLANAARSPEATTVLDDATVAARHAVDLVPARAVNHEQLARVLAARVLAGDTGAVRSADAAIERMAGLAPANALLLLEGARLELLIGRAESARSLAGRVTALYPGDARAEGVLGEAWFARGDTAQAGAALRRALDGNWRGDSAALDAARGLRARLR